VVGVKQVCLCGGKPYRRFFKLKTVQNSLIFIIFAIFQMRWPGMLQALIGNV
jgi:hypothetical protein